MIFLLLLSRLSYFAFFAPPSRIPRTSSSRMIRYFVAVQLDLAAGVLAEQNAVARA
jgi:hypothetical protein